jgi:flagellum-specific ATP synthase
MSGSKGWADRTGRAQARLAALPAFAIGGEVTAAGQGTFELAGFAPWFRIGQRVRIGDGTGPGEMAEIVRFHDDGRAQAVALGLGEDVGRGARCRLADPPAIAVSAGWLGRVVDPFGRPIDGKGPLPPGATTGRLRAQAPNAAGRARLGDRIDLGVGVLNAFTTCRRGQRLGLFAASGVGKSSLLAMIARRAACDVVVLGLVGERGRELREFVEEVLGPEGLARSVVVCATSDASAPLRRDAALAAMAVAEQFAEAGQDVLLLMDSVTRYALALREVGLAAGEPPVARGYTPSVFAELPRLMERCGPRGEDAGMITGIFTVLVDGDDHDEPIADAVRGILDGHVVLDRRIAEGGRYPAVDILRSLSRTVPGCLTDAEWALVRRARQILATAAEMAEMVRLGAYRAGTDAVVDEALRLAPRIEAVMAQDSRAQVGIEEAFSSLSEAMAGATAEAA